MSQCGWYIWQKPKQFESKREMVQWIHQYREKHPEKLGPDGTITMVGWNEENGKLILQTVSDWDKNLIWQIQTTSEHYEELMSILED